MNLKQVAQELTARQARLFLPDESGQRPCHGAERRYADDPHFKDLVLFYEHFHGDDGRGVGASHQTGWTALAARYVERTTRARDSHAATAPRTKRGTTAAGRGDAAPEGGLAPPGAPPQGGSGADD